MTPERARRDLKRLKQLQGSADLRRQEQAMTRGVAAFAVVLIGVTVASKSLVASLAIAVLAGLFFKSEFGRNVVIIGSAALLVLLATQGPIFVPKRRHECDIGNVRRRKLDAMIAEPEAFLISTARMKP
jgi:CBS domain containing-hemolysin-like protein